MRTKSFGKNKRSMESETMEQNNKAAVDLSVDLAGIRMQNPILTASGICGYGLEYLPYVDLSKMGAFTTKSITMEPRDGNPSPRLAETRAGLLNSIGLANVGIERFVADKLPQASRLGIPIFVNVAGKTVAEYCAVAERLDAEESIAALELNISCPNVASGGLEFGLDPVHAGKLIAEIRKVVKNRKLIVKLTPNVTDIAELARAAVDAGADILSLINTLRGMTINVETRRPVLPRGVGGLSGPAVKPVAVYCVWKVYNEVAKKNNIPIIGIGGVQFWQDAVELMLAGATAVALGTVMYVNPKAPLEVIEGMEAYCKRHNIARLADIVGTAEKPRVI
jgi:dihydroorotate dehydrogenase (NAD+) catalytic subunit